MHRAPTVEQLAREFLAMQNDGLGGASDLQSLLDKLISGCLRILPGAVGAQVEMHDIHGATCYASDGVAPRTATGDGRLSGTLFEKCQASREAYLCTDVAQDPQVNLAACRAAGVTAMVLAPILQPDSVAGVLEIFAAEPDALGETDLLIAQLLAGGIAAGYARLARDEAYRTRDRMAQHFQATFDQAAVGIAHVSLTGNFLLVNDRFCTITGHSRETLLQSGFQKITHPDDLDADVGNLKRLAAHEITSYSIEKRYIKADLELVWVNLTVSLVQDKDDGCSFLVAVIEDISNRKIAEHKASHDALTGLPNRLWLTDNFKREIADGQPAPAVLAYVDIDGFKSVNDRLGHAEGDRCLVTIASCLQFALAAGDTVCRIAGDEFVVLMPRTGREAAMQTIAQIHHFVRTLSVGQPWDVGVSIGAVMIDPLQEVDLDVILSAADRMMYRAKRTSPNMPVLCELEEALAA